tara:strand:- start:1220 stop:1528 length:309 start_codon:yes stop_codon:yes gene_type:complete
MKIIISILMLSFLLSHNIEKTFKIEGMTCGGCANKVVKAVDALDGVKSCDVNVDKGQAKIMFDDSKINEKEILAILNDKTNFSCTIPEKKVRKGLFQRLFGW